MAEGCFTMTVDLGTISFRNDPFLIAEGLKPSNVLDYFYESQFYASTGGPTSINEMIRRGTIAPSQAARVDGEIYQLVSANSDGEAGLVDTSIFVIQKFRQTVNKPRVPLEVFYIVSGTIYLAPGLGKLIERHLENGIRHFDEMIDSIKNAFFGSPAMDESG